MGEIGRVRLEGGSIMCDMDERRRHRDPNSIRFNMGSGYIRMDGWTPWGAHR